MAVKEDVRQAAGVTFAEHPVVSATTGRAIAVSVVPVVRRAHHVIPPDSLRAIAASDGFLLDLEAASLDHALTLVRARPGHAAIVRISAASIESPGFVSQLAARMEAAGVSPASLWLEVDDAAQVIAHRDVMQVLAPHCTLGCQIHDGDIVTTRSALGELADIGVAFITLTPELTRSACSDTADAIMMRSLARRGDLNGMTVIARGIDRHGGEDRARTLGIGLLERAGDAA